MDIEEKTVIREAQHLTKDAKKNVKSSPEVSQFEQRLMGLEKIFELQDLGGSRLSSEELMILERQLRELPPEVAMQSEPGAEEEVCKLCSSIIYRPLIDPENL